MRMISGRDSNCGSLVLKVTSSPHGPLLNLNSIKTLETKMFAQFRKVIEN